MSLTARGRKTLAAFATAVILAGTVSLSTTKAEAYPGFGWGWGGFAGGLAVGALAATAAAPAYGYGYGYAPVYGGCLRSRSWVDGFGYVHTRRWNVCY